MLTSICIHEIFRPGLIISTIWVEGASLDLSLDLCFSPGDVQLEISSTSNTAP
jgi:hypothetical protein